MKRPKEFFVATAGQSTWMGRVNLLVKRADHRIPAMGEASYIYNCKTRTVFYSSFSLPQLAELEHRNGNDRDSQADAWDRYRAWKEQARARRKAMAARKLAKNLPTKQPGSGQRILSSHRKARRRLRELYAIRYKAA